jgi:ferredoxin
VNFFAFTERLAGETDSAVHLDAARCVHASDKQMTCSACRDVCPVNAIQGDGVPAVDGAACLACRACLPLCPTGALQMEDDVDGLLRCAARLDGPVVEVVCQHHPAAGVGEGDAAVRVHGCLAGLGPGAYLLLAAGTHERIVARVDACATCPWGALRAQIEAQVATAQALLSPWQRAGRLALSAAAPDPGWQPRPLYGAGAPPVSRRDLFRRRHEEDEAVDPVAGGDHPYRERMRALRAWQQLGSYEAADGATQMPAAARFATVTVADTCDACGTCARACPSGALVLDKTEGDDYFWLRFSPAACLACDLCASLCPQQAIAVHKQPTFNTILGSSAAVTLRKGPLRRCQRCQTLFAPAHPGDSYCTLCAFRQRDPFGSHLPPHLQARVRRRGNGGER